MARYIHGHDEAVLRAHRVRTAANSAAHLVPHLHPGLALLDVGCGEGTITRDLARLVAPGPVVGVDRAAEVVATAAADPANPDNVTFETADLMALPHPDHSFDVAHLHQVLHHVPDPVAALRAIARVVRPGGLIADREADFGAAWWYPACPGWEIWQNTFVAVAAAEGEDLTIARQLLRVAHEAGFADVTLSASCWSYPGFQPRQSATATWAERLTSPHFVDLAEAAGAADRATLEQAVADIVTWAENEDAAFFHPHTEILIRLP